MNIVIVRSDRLFEPVLPVEVAGKHWLSDIDEYGRKRRIAFVQAQEGAWELFPFGGVQLVGADGEELESALLGAAEQSLLLKTAEGECIHLLCGEPGEQALVFTKLGLKAATDIAIGRADGCELRYENRFVSGRHALLRYEGESFAIIDTNSANGVYVNGRAIPKNEPWALKPADRVWIMGLVLTVGRRFLAYNNPGLRACMAESENFVSYSPEKPAEPKPQAEKEPVEAFSRSPRLMRSIEPKTLDVEAPPAKKKPDESPAILKIGPSLCMALGSAMMGVFMLTNLLTGEGNALRALPMASMMVVMILGAVLWPNLSRRYERGKAQRDEETRRRTYVAYLDRIREGLLSEARLQATILHENRVTVDVCLERAAAEDSSLFERTPLHDDFLALRIGTGELPLAGQVKFPQERITLEKDDLMDMMRSLEREPRMLAGVPIVVELIRDYVIGIAGEKGVRLAFMRGLVAQLAALHAPDEVKCVMLADEEDYAEWRFVGGLPHFASDDKETVFIATDKAEAAELSLRIERELQGRLKASSAEAADFAPYYVVFVANRELAAATEAVKSLAELRRNYGFSLVTLAADVRELPKECSCVIELAEGRSFYYDPADAPSTAAEFACDILLGGEAAMAFMADLGAVPLENAEAQFALPKSLGFLEMFEAGTVEQLNIEARWEQSDPTVSLAVPLGVDPQGMLSLLDVHENAHGPHGLIAGTTGSGKSETIITMILAGVVSFRPDELAYVLIDYKGGGLAGAFDSPARRLPHLAGTITNLDGSAIRRSLVSIKSELKRRQALFNSARDSAGLSTMDIYRYQALYRQGRVADPCPHLLIIADEFAELKTQQPEFIAELVSAARIGRSLGVHLILATQKPSGVVNDQISSNSRFRICLKVADAADSKEMIRRPDAAEVTDAGRYYLLVGYNEYFAMGQSAYAGTSYRPCEHFEPSRDDAIMLVSNTGRVLDMERPRRAGLASEPVPESIAVLDEVIRVSEKLGLKAQSLWLEPIPTYITLEELRARHAAQPESFVLAPLVGEYDDPAHQAQRPLRLPITEKGNIIVFGSGGSGTETFLNTMVFSLITEYSPADLHLYLFDLGAELLGAFREAPHVGDVVFGSEEEKVLRLFAMLKKTIEDRKKVVSASGLAVAAYNRQADEPLPSIVVVINGINNFYELFLKLEDELNTLTREANRYGLYFVISGTTATAARSRLRTNFKQNIVLSLNDESEYINALGSIRGIVPPVAYARGLVPLGEIYEFQTAHCCTQDETEAAAIAAKCAELAAACTHRAPAVPVLPAHASLELLAPKPVAGQAIPFGIIESTLAPAVFSFEDKPFSRCLYARQRDGSAFLKALLVLLTERQSYYEPVLVDVAGLLPDDSSSPCRRYSAVDEAMCYFDELYDFRAKPPEKPHFVVLCGIGKLLKDGDSAKVAIARIYLKTLAENEGAVFLLFDNIANVNYTSDEWFTVQFDNKNGLWAGAGMANHSPFSLQYPDSNNIDSKLKGDRGYVVTDGRIAAARLATLTD